VSTSAKDAIFTKNGSKLEIGRNLGWSLLQILLKYPAILSRPISEFIKRILKSNCIVVFVLHLQAASTGCLWGSQKGKNPCFS